MAMYDINDILEFAKQVGASDIHFAANEPPILRIDGSIKRLDKEPMSPEEVKELIVGTMNESVRTEFESTNDVDYAIEAVGSRFRVNAMMEKKTASMVMRFIPTEILTLEQLNAPEVLHSLLDYKNGLVLVTGPTGSGKSTTMAAMINEINATRREHILTFEDPIEFVHPSKMSIVRQREIGVDSASFGSALKGALRQDPDIILVGELRDLETIRLALSAAETGHLVFGTLHTNSATKTVDRIIDVFPAEEKDLIRTMLAESLRGVVAQMLLPRDPKGRVAVHEILMVNKAVANNIRSGKTHQLKSQIQIGKKDGMISWQDSVGAHIESGSIDPDLGLAFIAKMNGESDDS